MVDRNFSSVFFGLMKICEKEDIKIILVIRVICFEKNRNFYCLLF